MENQNPGNKGQSGRSSENENTHPASGRGNEQQATNNQSGQKTDVTGNHDTTGQASTKAPQTIARPTAPNRVMLLFQRIRRSHTISGPTKMIRKIRISRGTMMLTSNRNQANVNLSGEISEFPLFQRQGPIRSITRQGIQ